MHGPSVKSSYGRGPQLTLDECRIIKAAVEMTSRKAAHILRPLNEVYMLPIDAIFDERTLNEILVAGHSRIPIFEGEDPIAIVGVVLAKKLIMVDPKQRLSVREAMKHNVNSAFTEPYFVPENEMVHNMLDVFQEGRTHMAFVLRKNRKTGKEEVCGIVTLEHIIEALLREEIWDETDKLRKPGSTRLEVLQRVEAELIKKKAEALIAKKMKQKHPVLTDPAASVIEKQKLGHSTTVVEKQKHPSPVIGKMVDSNSGPVVTAADMSDFHLGNVTPRGVGVGRKSATDVQPKRKEEATSVTKKESSPAPPEPVEASIKGERRKKLALLTEAILKQRGAGTKGGDVPGLQSRPEQKGSVIVGRTKAPPSKKPKPKEKSKDDDNDKKR